MKDKGIEILKPGITTIQDCGRLNNRKLGVPASGYMDWFSAYDALGQFESGSYRALLETYYEGLKMKFHCDCMVSISGAASKVFLNEKSIQEFSLIKINHGDIVEIKEFKNGYISYLAFSYSFKLEKVMNSYSHLTGFDIEGLPGNLKKGDIILFENIPFEPTKSNYKLKYYGSEITVRYLIGPEFNYLDNTSTEVLNTETFTVEKDSNRIGYRLSGKKLINTHSQINSSSTFPGTMQLTNEGKIIILMRDGQVTGGYPRIGNIIWTDLNYLSQMKPGSKIRFKPISAEEALKTYKKQKQLKSCF
jgi:biotin-dependent carboxylase-like uncharacterized protein